ncbi:hypothetical protein VN96_0452 [Lactococcus cremoris]|uniref:hypothetical protein n=1 Tax=Lactococcus lactis subsp. cremoris TaxID=1359 RepID=UPI00062A1E26|nr:hypothetical protein [Lactococcus cremoris]KKW73797.1 hypothetical protein VN96_0452 [Lactococcus cremoris]RDG21499.1 hypothetical protein DQM05_11890 [Lactococcus cremoris]
MKKIGKNKIILTLSSLAILAGVSTIALASQSYKKTSNTASASAITKTSISAGPENSASRKEAGRDSFPDEESYLNYKKMRDEVKEGELIVEQSDPDIPNRKDFIGTKSEFIIENWSIEKDNSGNQLLKVPFKFINKTNNKVDLKEYIKNRITAQQLLTESLHSLTDLIIEEYPAKIVVDGKGSYSGFLYIRVIQDKPNFGITFNISYVSGGTNNKGGGVILHDLKANPSF